MRPDVLGNDSGTRAGRTPAVGGRGADAHLPFPHLMRDLPAARKEPALFPCVGMYRQ